MSPYDPGRPGAANVNFHHMSVRFRGGAIPFCLDGVFRALESTPIPGQGEEP